MRPLASVLRRLCQPTPLVALLALAMTAAVAVPASYWKSPKTDFTLRGFDPNLMYSSPQGPGSVHGVLQFTQGSLLMSAVPGSRPVVDLATSPLSYNIAFDATIVEAQPDSTPLVLDISAPYFGYHYDFIFTAAPLRQVLLERLHKDAVVSLRALGVYTIGQQYDVSVNIDRAHSKLSVTVTSPPSALRPADAIYVASTGPKFSSHVITIDTVPVVAGRSYELSADTKPLTAGEIGMSIDWLSASGRRVGGSSQWAPIAGLSAWAGRDFDATAPSGATRARIELATANGGQALFAQAHFSGPHKGAPNLLSNGSFLDGAAGWRRADNTAPLQTSAFRDGTWSAQISGAKWKPLFSSLRMAVSVEALSTGGLSNVALSSYELSVPHQRWVADLVDDTGLRLLLVGLGLLGLAAIVLAVRRRRYLKRLRLVISRFWNNDRVLVLDANTRRVTLVVGIAVLIYIVGNGLLSRIGSLNADIIGARVWAYTAGAHGPGALYFSPNVASAEAGQWQGLPLQEASFPYGPVMAYIFWAMGLVYDLFLHQPYVGTLDTNLVDGLLRATNAVFAALDAYLAYLIVRQGERNVPRAVIVLVVLAFNPAIWFAGDVWATTQAISTAFLLAALYFAYRHRLVVTWVLLLAGAMTRPQNLVPALLLGAFVFVTNPKARSLVSLAWAVVITFLYLLPLSLTVAPSLPIDVLANVFLLHVGHGNDPWTMPASYGAMSIWPLITQVVGHASGEARISFRATRLLFGNHSYYNLGNQLGALFELGLVGLVLVLRRNLRRPGQMTLVLAAGSTGLLMLITGAPGYYFVMPLCFIAASRSALTRRVWWFCLVALSATTFLSEYAMGAYWLDNHLVWGVGVYSPHFAVANWLATLPNNNLFVTACCAVNIVVFGVLMYRAIRPTPRIVDLHDRRAQGKFRHSLGAERSIYSYNDVAEPVDNEPERRPRVVPVRRTASHFGCRPHISLGEQ